MALFKRTKSAALSEERSIRHIQDCNPANAGSSLFLRRLQFENRASRFARAPVPAFPRVPGGAEHPLQRAQQCPFMRSNASYKELKSTYQANYVANRPARQRLSFLAQRPSYEGSQTARLSVMSAAPLMVDDGCQTARGSPGKVPVEAPAATVEVKRLSRCESAPMTRRQEQIDARKLEEKHPNSNEAINQRWREQFVVAQADHNFSRCNHLMRTMAVQSTLPMRDLLSWNP